LTLSRIPDRIHGDADISAMKGAFDDDHGIFVHQVKKATQYR